MNELALFAGVGGGLLGSKLLGWRTVCAVEKAPYRREVLLRRQRDGVLDLFPIWDDVQTFDAGAWRGLVDIISAGFPCQPFSTAARGRLVAKDLWPEVIRIANKVQPRFVFVENVLGSRMDGLLLSAAEVGAPHLRQRVWALGDADKSGQSNSTFNAEAPRVSKVDKTVWEVDPRDIRMANGMAHRVDRLRAIGDGQVPAVVRRAWLSLTL